MPRTLQIIMRFIYKRVYDPYMQHYSISVLKYFSCCQRKKYYIKTKQHCIFIIYCYFNKLELRFQFRAKSSTTELENKWNKKKIFFLNSLILLHNSVVDDLALWVKFVHFVICLTTDAACLVCILYIQWRDFHYDKT